MFLYKSDVSMLRVLQPARMQQVMNNSAHVAEKNIKHATYGVVMQIDGKIVGLLPVCVVDDMSHVTGAYTSHQENFSSHNDVVREKLEMFIGELGDKPAMASVAVTAIGNASHPADIFLQCGFVMKSSTKDEMLLNFGMSI